MCGRNASAADASTAEARKEKGQAPKKNLEEVWAIVSVKDADTNKQRP
jgi:hypothetical protein